MKVKKHERRKTRVRINIRAKAKDRPRLSVHRTNKNLYAQIIDDTKNITLATASTLESDFKSQSGLSKDSAKKIGELVGKRAMKAGIKDVVFDRGQFLYHGRIKVLAEAAREAGLNF